MAVHLVTDPAEMLRLLDARLELDPVKSTILGTIRTSIERPDAQPWVAKNDVGGLAVRSQPEYPAVIDGAWPESERPALVAALADLPDLVGVSGATGVVESVADSVAEPSHVRAMRLFRLGALNAPAAVQGAPRRAESPDRDLAVEWYRAFEVESHGRIPDVEHLVDTVLGEGGCWLWLDAHGIPVSLASRQPVVAGSARIGPVYTPPAERARGYGSAVTAAATRDILDDGAIPVLFTDLANPTSNKIYEALGYQRVEDRTEYRFERVRV